MWWLILYSYGYNMLHVFSVGHPWGKGEENTWETSYFSTATKILNLCLIKKGIVQVDDSLLSLKAEN